MKNKKTVAILIGIAAIAVLTGGAFTAKSLTAKAEPQPAAQEIITVPQALAANNNAAATSAKQSLIGETKAKEIALAHANISAADATFVRVNLNWDDGRQEYEVEFWSSNLEFDYDIDAISGKILSYDRDAEYYAPKATDPAVADNNKITAAEAKKIALKHAGFLESEVMRLTAEYDLDDGRAEYDVEFYVGRMEYSYEINAVDGKILSYDVEQDD